MRDYGDENDAKGGKLNFDEVVGHPNLSPAINNAILESAINGGAWLKDLAEGKALRITTQNSTYILRKQAGGKTYKLEQVASAKGGYQLPGKDNPVIVTVNGSTWGGSMLKAEFVGRGMHLECNLPSQYGLAGRRTLTTSKIQEIKEIE